MTITLHSYFNNDTKQGVEMDYIGLVDDVETYRVTQLYEVGGQWNIDKEYTTIDRKKAKSTFNRYKRAIEQ